MKLKLLSLFVLLLSITLNGQNVNVSGAITEASSGQPLPGVNVIIKNTSIGTSTDFDGNFTLNDVPLNSVIVVSYIGFVTQEITITNNNPLAISLLEDAESLNEVVVIGYGTQKKKEVTGAVSVVDAKAIEKLNPQRVEQALQGQVAGVSVTSNSGSPGSGSNIRIRGISTNGDARPLILVDGNVIEDLSVINPSDIKTMNILKDATAGIYGVRAANGVILITTKSGRKDSELKFQIDSYAGFQTTSKKIDLLGPTDFAIYVNDAADDTEYFVYPQKGTDWQDEVFRTAAISNINFSANGGTKKSAYSFGASYLDQDGIVGASKNNYSRLTARLSYQYDILENLKVSVTGLHTISEKNNLAEGGIGAVLYNAVNVNPDLSIRDEFGNYSLVEQLSAIEIVNPLAQIENTFNTTRVSKVAATLGLDYTFLKNFKFSSKFQINHANVRDDIFRPEVNYGPGKTLNQDGNEIVDNGADFDDYTWDNYLTYTNSFNDIHNLTVLLGTSIFRTKGLFYGIAGVTDTNTNSFGDSVYDLDGVPTLTPRFNDAAIAVGNNVFDDRLGSVFARVQYNYKGKYLISAAVRRDGSSKFGADNRYGYFPTGSIGWNISDEAFLENSSWLNSLKLRASYGIIGNDRIPSFGFVSLLTGEATYAPGSETSQDDLLNGTAIGLIGNPSLKWEEQVAQNIGFDARLFNSKVSLSMDLFSRKTEDLLLSPQASGLIGSAAPGSALPFVNAGTVENKGIEISVGFNDSVGEDFSYNLGFNISTLDNEVVSVNGNIPPVGGEFGVGISQTGIARMVPGLPIGHFYGYKTDGIYQTQGEIDALDATAPSGTYSTVGDIAPGDLRFVDVNGDGEITADDRTNIGDPIAEITMGFNLGFQYKNIDFSATAFASIGNDMVRDYERKNLFANRGTYQLDRWQGTGTSNSVPRAVGGASINTDVFSDFYVEDASFLRLQNVQIGYTFSEKQIRGLGIDKLRIYVSGNNLFTLSDYFGYDPSASNGAPIGSGIDKGFYPVASSYLLGVNLNF
jgi:TonB-linked SusC/RagA family outer membrane protein